MIILDDNRGGLMERCSLFAVVTGALALGALLLIEVLELQSWVFGGAGSQLTVIGKLHPVFLHIPIGVFIYIACCEAVTLLTREKFQTDIRPALLLGGVTAVITTILGCILTATGDYGMSALLEEHKRDGFIFTFLALATLFVKVNGFQNCSEKIQLRSYRILLLFTLLSLVSTGHHGGEISHGPLFREVSVSDRANGVDHERGGISYEVMVKPILAAKCESCHGEKKQKGGLRVDSLAAMLEGGDQGPSVVAGDLNNSLLISSLHLPLDDELRMPPEGKPQLTEEEIAILEEWVSSGASLSK